ncbi:cornifelin homolog [Pholidichthys leucotaenia]
MSEAESILFAALESSAVPSQEISHPGPVAEKQPQSVMFPLPCFTVAMEFHQNVVHTQPRVNTSQYAVSSGMSDWSSSVFDCCDDCGICLCGAFVPCILEFKLAQDSGENICLPCLPGSMLALRTSLRHRYNIEGSICGDWCMLACFPHCALCQMAREMKARGH